MLCCILGITIAYVEGLVTQSPLLLIMGFSNDFIFFLFDQLPYVNYISDIGIVVLLLVGFFVGLVDMRLFIVGCFELIARLRHNSFVESCWNSPDYSLIELAALAQVNFPFPMLNFLNKRDKRLDELYALLGHSRNNSAYDLE